MNNRDGFYNAVFIRKYNPITQVPDGNWLLEVDNRDELIANGAREILKRLKERDGQE